MSKAILRDDAPLFSLLNKKDQGDNVSECLTCGVCSSRCSWYEGEGGPVPRQIVRMAQLGLDDLLIDSGMLWDCMLCNRCTEECPVGITMDQVVRRARSLQAAYKIVPEDLKIGIKNRLELGDVNSLTKEEFVETVEWLSEEFSDDMGDPEAVIPYDKKGARFLYLPNPRELGINLLHLTAMAKLFYSFKESWTMSSHHTDVTNWGYFIGDDDICRKMALQIVDATEDLGAETLVLSECGHGYFVLKTLLEDLIGRKPKFNVVSMPELTLEMVEKGAIELDPTTLDEPVAYHDPCNLARKSGVYDIPRKLLSLCCKEVVELMPNREHAICCGGGGGLVQDSTSVKHRMISGKPKADQIKTANVKHLATACLSCHRQLGELVKHYDLGVKVHTVVSLAVEALKTKKP
ncbi:MAG: (Fe-S)-binding protein [Desulfobacterales bacterium]